MSDSSPLPAKEGAPRDRHENFYFMQEDALRQLCKGGSLSWTILRPQVVYGESIGSPMNLLPAIGVYAALEKARGRPLCFPGGTPTVQEAVDARLLARAISWAGESRQAANEIFNVTNGDVFSWPDIWPEIAAAFGMEVGEPKLTRLADAMPPRAAEWADDRRPPWAACAAGHVRIRREFMELRRHPLRFIGWSIYAGFAQHDQDPPSRIR